MIPSWQCDSKFDSPDTVALSFNHLYTSFMKLIENAMFSIPISPTGRCTEPTFSVQALGVTFSSMEDPTTPGVYRFKMDFPELLGAFDDF